MFVFFIDKDFVALPFKTTLFLFIQRTFFCFARRRHLKMFYKTVFANKIRKIICLLVFFCRKYIFNDYDVLVKIFVAFFSS